MKNSEASLLGSLVVGGLGCFLLLFLWWKRRSPSPNLPLPPGTFGFLWIGETVKYFNALRVGCSGGFVRERTAKFGSKTFKTKIFFQNMVVVQGVAANRFIAAAENRQQLLNSWPASIIKVLGEHTPVAKHGAPHRRLRQIMTSCLGAVALRKLVRKVDLITQLHVESCWKAQSQLFLLSLIKQNAFSIACRLLAGIEDEALLERMYIQFEIFSHGVVSIPVDLPGTAFRRAKNAKQVLLCELGKVIDSKLQTCAEQPVGDEDLLGLMVRARSENGSVLNREELQDVILFLLFAGYDTTTTTLSFVLKYLEQNPDCHHRLIQEHKAIASQKTTEKRLNWEDIHNMKYTWAVIQETMRLRPIAPGGFKEAKHDIDFEGYRIPQGWKMYYDITSTHNDETFFPQPHKFDPSRFEIEKLQEGNSLPPYVFIPFGVGPHSCPGGEFARMTMSIYLHQLALRQFRWTSIDPNEKIHVLPILKLAKGYPAKVFIEREP